MLTFKKWTKILGYSAALLLFLILALIFFDMVTKQASVKNGVVKIENKAQANSVDMWRISFNGKKRFRLKADSMDRKKDGVVILHNAKLWYFESSKPVIFIRANKAIVYTNNNVYATGKVLLTRKDLIIHAKSVFWDDKLKIAKSKESFDGVTQKSSFNGKSFIYYQKKDELIVNGADIWLK